MIPQIGYIYTYEGTCFITLAMDDVNEQDLEEYNPDLVESYDRPEDDGEFEVIKKGDPRYENRKQYLHERLDSTVAFRALNFLQSLFIYRISMIKGMKYQMIVSVFI